MQTPLAEYHTSSARIRFWLLLGLFFILLGIGLTFLGILSYRSFVYNQMRPAMILGPLAAVCGVWALLNWWSWRDIHVFEYLEGMVIRQGKRQEIIQWDEIEEVEQMVNAPTGNEMLYSYRIKTKSNGPYIIDNRLPGVDRLGASIQKHVTNHQYQVMKAKFESGQPIVFGPLTLRQSGLQKDSIQVPWHALAPIAIKDGLLIIRQKAVVQPLMKLRLSSFPNIYVLLSILHDLIGFDQPEDLAEMPVADHVASDIMPFPESEV